MEKKTEMLVVALVVVVILGFWYYSTNQTAVNNLPSTSNTTTNPVSTTNNTPTSPKEIPPAMPLNVTKIEGQQISYSWQGLSGSVTVGSETKIAKMVYTNNKFTSQTAKLSDIKVGQIIMVTLGASGKPAVSIQILK